jgi:hypothetical protein
MPRNSRAEFLMIAKRLSAAYLANAASLPGLETLHQEFATMLTELEGLGVLQDAQTAAVQQTTKEIEERLTLGRILATRLRDGVKLHLGTRTEKVIEFGVRPFRKRARAPKIVEVPVLVIKEDATEKTETTETTP